MNASSNFIFSANSRKVLPTVIALAVCVCAVVQGIKTSIDIQMEMMLLWVAHWKVGNLIIRALSTVYI